MACYLALPFSPATMRAMHRIIYGLHHDLPHSHHGEARQLIARLQSDGNGEYVEHVEEDNCAVDLRNGNGFPHGGAAKSPEAPQTQGGVKARLSVSSSCV